MLRRAVVAATFLASILCLQTQIVSAQMPKPVIVLDAGHGGNDAGAGGTASEAEKHLTLQAVRSIARVFEAEGFGVQLTRTTDSAVSLEDRAGLVAATDADLFISVHGSGSRDAATHGLQVFVPPDDSESRLFAAGFAAAYPDDASIPMAGVSDARFLVFQGLSTPAILIELGYLTHAEESKIVASAEHHGLVARTLVAAVRSYLSGS